MPDRLDLRKRRSTALIVAASFVVAASMIVLLMELATGQQTGSASARAIAEERRNLSYALDLMSDVQDMETNLRAYGVLHTRTYRNAYLAARERVVAGREKLQSQRAIADVAVSAAALDAALERRLTLAAQAFRHAEAGEYTLGANASLERDIQSTSTRLRNSLDAYVDDAETRAQHLLQRTEKEQSIGNALAAVFATLASLASAVTLWALMRERRSWTTANADMRRANAELEIAHRKAREADEAKSRFLTVASHDLRQPLHALSLYINALRRRVDGDETIKILDSMDRATQSMIAMFSRLLDLARIQSGVLKPSIEDISVQEGFERVSAEFADARIALTPTDLLVRTDARLLQVILRNFVSNAVKHGGGDVRLFARREGELVRICVSDNGPGVPADKVSEIFNEFTRLNPEKSEGLGLGLAIVQQGARRLGLAVDVRDTAGGGAEFSVCVPIGLRLQPQRSMPELDIDLSGLNIIAVDDEPLALEAIAQVLRDAGANVRTGDSVAALEVLLEQEPAPDAIVLDLRLDGEIRGVEAANAARARVSHHLPILIVTGDTGADTFAMLQSSGYPWLIKPASSEALMASIGRIAKTRAPPTSAAAQAPG